MDIFKITINVSVGTAVDDGNYGYGQITIYETITIKPLTFEAVGNALNRFKELADELQPDA